MSETNGLSSTKKLLEGLIKPEGVYDGAKILEIVKRLNQNTNKGILTVSLRQVLTTFGINEKFRPALTRFLKILKVLVRDPKEQIWHVTPVEVAKFLLQPIYVKSAHEEIKREWTMHGETKKMRAICAQFKKNESRATVRVDDRLAGKNGDVARRSVSIVGTDLPKTKAELRAFVLKVFEEEELKKKQ